MTGSTLKVSSPDTSIKRCRLVDWIKSITQLYDALSKEKKKDTSTCLTLDTKINSKCVTDLNI